MSMPRLPPEHPARNTPELRNDTDPGRVRLPALLAIRPFFALSAVPGTRCCCGQHPRPPRRRDLRRLRGPGAPGHSDRLRGHPQRRQEVHTLWHDAPHHAAQLHHHAAFRHYDDRYHITAKILRVTHPLIRAAGQGGGPLKDVTVGAASRPVPAGLPPGDHRHQGRRGWISAGEHPAAFSPPWRPGSCSRSSVSRTR